MSLIEVIQPASSASQNQNRPFVSSSSSNNQIYSSSRDDDLHQQANIGATLRQKLALEGIASNKRKLEPMAAGFSAVFLAATGTGATATATADSQLHHQPIRLNQHLHNHHNLDHHHHHHNHHHNNHHQRDQSGTINESNGNNNVVSNLVFQYVNLNLVRDMIVQHAIELVLILVIVTYLIYYFARISSRPKLIGDHRSRFVKFIQNQLSDTLTRRFNPLIYFWGTNPQTALFGYLQGQTSADEMPRSKFLRQHLYISDAQYLASNVDLSQHYRISAQLPAGVAAGDESSRRATKGKIAKKVKRRREKFSQRSTRRLDQKPVLQLAPIELRRDERESKTTTGGDSGSQLDANLRLALNGMLKMNGGAEPPRRPAFPGSSHSVALDMKTGAGPQALAKDSSPSSGCSTTDSGVFATGSRAGSSASRSSSASSLSEVCMASNEGSTIAASSCQCKLLYESPLFLDLAGAEPPESPAKSGSASPTAAQDDAAKSVVRECTEFGQCALDWHLDSHAHYHEHKQVALISAGMTTGSDKKYVTDTVRSLESLGYEVCVFIRRGVGGLTLSSARFFSPSKWRDFEAAVQSVRQQRPGARLVAVGFSFGSIELCRYLSMTGARSQVDAALLVSCPFDPEAGGRNMRRRALNRRIDAYLAKNLGKQLHWALFNGQASALGAGQDVESSASANQMYNYNGSLVNLNSLPKIKSLVDFEENYNRRVQHYPNSEAYADDSRLNEHLASIRTPTLCLSSEDDFMAPLKLLPVEEIQANPNLCMLLTKRGGHMAFIDGLVWPRKPYFAQRIIKNYLGALSSRGGSHFGVDIKC